MTATINTAFISQFSDNMHMLLEQKASTTRSIFSVEIANGEKHFFDRLGNFTATEITNRLAPTALQDGAHSRRMATVKRYGAPTYLDDIDKFKMLIDPTSDYVSKLASAHGKKFDEVILEALIGTAATGADGTGTQTLGSGQQIAHGSTGLTVTKFNQALRMLQAAEVNISDGLVLLTGARGIEDMLAEVTFTSFDYQNGKVLSGSNLPSYRGVEIVHTERLAEATPGSVYRAVLCSKDALKVAMAQDLTVKVGERVDLNHAYQVSTFMMYGAVRMEEARVVDILFQ